jgi:hypothetical protein
VKEFAMPLPRLPVCALKLHAGVGALLLLGTASPAWLLARLHGLTAAGAHRLSLSDWDGLRNVALLLLAAETAAAIVLTRWLLGQIGGPLREAAAAARRVAEGDLSGRPGAGAGTLMGAMQAMNDKLSATVLALRERTDRVADGAGEIACASMALAGRGARQAAGLGQIRAVVGELAACGAGPAVRIEQLGRAATALERGALDHAALVEQLAATAARLRDETVQLNRILAAFVLAPEHARPPVRMKLVASNPGKLAGRRGKERGRVRIAPVAAQTPAAPQSGIDSRTF